MKLHNGLLKQISPSSQDSRPVELFQERERTATVLLLDLRAGMSRMWRSKAEANLWENGPRYVQVSHMGCRHMDISYIILQYNYNRSYRQSLEGFLIGAFRERP